MPAKQLVYVGTGGLTSDSKAIYLESQERYYVDGRAYSLHFDYSNDLNDYLFDTARPTNTNYSGLFLTPQFILNHLVGEGELPDEAKEIEFYDMSGEYKNMGSNSYNQTIPKDRVGPGTFNGINGVVVMFLKSISNSNSYSSWKFDLPVTLRYTTVFGESGLPIVPLD